MRTYELQVNRVADEVWQEFRQGLGIGYSRPTVVFSDEANSSWVYVIIGIFVVFLGFFLGHRWKD